MEAPARSWRPSSRVIALVAAAFLAGIVFSHALRTVFFLFFLAFLLAVLLDYPVRFLAKLLPRGLAAALVLLVILGGTFAAVRFAVPPLLDQGKKVAQDAPSALDKAEGWWNEVRKSAPVDGVPTGDEMKQDAKASMQERSGSIFKAVLPLAASTLTAVSTIILMLVLATFMVAAPRTYEDGFVWMLPPEAERPTREFLTRLVLTLRGWMFAQLLSMTFVGIVTAIGLMLIGVKGWAALAVLNFVCEFVPYIGPFVGAAPGVAVAFADSTSKGAYAALLYLGIQQFEGLVISPLVMRREVHLAPPVLLLWQVLMGAAFGALGIIVATPILACVKVSLDYFWVERTLGRKTEVPA